MQTQPQAGTPGEPAAGATLSVAKSEVLIAATAESIARAIDGQSGPSKACFFVELPNEDNIAVDAEEGGTFFLEVIEGAGSRSQFASGVDRGTLKAMLVSFVQGDGNWRSMCTWKAPREAPAEEAWYADTQLVAAWAGLGVVVILDLVFLGLGKTKWVGALFVLAVPVLLVAAIVTKLREVRRAANWTKGSARILSAEFTDATVNGRNLKVPAVEYEFPVRFDKFKGKRISLGEIMPGSVQAEMALARYAVGSSVPVYYDPGNPKDCVLERDVPPYFGVIWGFVAVVTVSCLVGAAMILR